MSEFTHFDAAGNALMVDVSDKLIPRGLQWRREKSA